MGATEEDPVPEIYRRALTAHQAGRLEEAAADYARVLSLDGGHAGALYLLALIQVRHGHPDMAETLLRAALAVQEQGPVLCALAQLLQESARPDEAETLYRRALALEAAPVDALCGLAGLLRHGGRVGEAEDALRRALHFAPDRADIHYNLGNLLLADARPAEAAAAYQRAIALQPDHGDAHNNRGNALKALGRHDEAEAAYASAIATRPDFPQFRHNLAGLFRETGRTAQAEQKLRSLLDAWPDHAAARFDLAKQLAETGRRDEAEDEYRRLLERHPGHHDGRWNLGLLLLQRGDYAAGWPLYDARLDREAPSSIPAAAGTPWRGEALAGKSLLVLAEQGFGDCIQFSRYLPALAVLGASRLTLACPRELVPLLRTLPLRAQDRIVGEDEVLPDHDFRVRLMSLPARLGTTLETLPASIPYLRTDPGLVRHWSGLLPAGGFRVGLVWRGNPGHGNDAHRSLPGLRTLAPLLCLEGANFISLQVDSAGATIAPIADDVGGAALAHPGARIRDFADTAAILSQLDLLISVDTAVAHLAGALGKACWLLLPAHDPDWRWLLDRDDSPWYPRAFRLFRQSRPGDWKEVAERLALELRTAVDAALRA